MQTYSHYILTVFARRRLLAREAAGGPEASRMPPIDRRTLLIGSVLPDIPLTIISIVFIAADMARGVTLDPSSEGAVSLTGYLFDDLFFNNVWVKLAHNLFHAPLLVLLYILLGYLAWKRGWGWGPALFWLGIACLFHTLIDIPIHYNDGPLLFFPFDLETRFYSPVSYWDPQRGGIAFAIFEHLLVLGVLVWLVFDWRRSRKPVVESQASASA